MSQNILRKGNKGDEVKHVQARLNKLGFKLEADGIFGEATDHAVRELQTLFGYTVDGIVGEGTDALMDAQLGYGWNYTAPDAKQRALAAQGKAAPAAAAAPAKGDAPAKGQQQQPKKS